MKLSTKFFLVLMIGVLYAQAALAFDFDAMEKRPKDGKLAAGDSSVGDNSLVPEVNFAGGVGISPTVKYLFKKDYTNGLRFAANGTLNGTFDSANTEDLITNYIATNGNMYVSGALSYEKELASDTRIYFGSAVGVSKAKHNQAVSSTTSKIVETNIAFIKLNVMTQIDELYLSYEYSNYSVSGADSQSAFETQLDKSSSQSLNFLIPAKNDGQKIWLNASVIKPNGTNWSFTIGAKTSVNLF